MKKILSSALAVVLLAATFFINGTIRIYRQSLKILLQTGDLKTVIKVGHG